jgi:hypothetical protein
MLKMEAVGESSESQLSNRLINIYILQRQIAVITTDSNKY